MDNTILNAKMAFLKYLYVMKSCIYNVTIFHLSTKGVKKFRHFLLSAILVGNAFTDRSDKLLKSNECVC